MNRLERRILTALAMAATLLITACDWDSGSQENFNTSGGSANVNVSGFYQGVQGAPVVARTSNGAIANLVIQQSGNRVMVTDSRGSTYEGTLGAPNVLAGNSTVPAGATVASYQIGFSGKDEVAAREIEFTGVLTIVSVTNIFADTDTRSVSTETTVNVNSEFPPLAPDTGTGTTTNTTTETGSTSETTSEFALEENNNQLQLRGTWIEIGGTTSSVRGIGPAAQGNVVTVN